MTMSEPIHIDPSVLHEVAAGHDEVVGHVESARARGSEISAAVADYGPIMHKVKEAVADVLTARDDALSSHSVHHSATSHELRRSAALYTNTDSDNAGGISGVTGA